VRILYFTQLFYPSLTGGGEFVFFQWAKELKKKGHDIFVITQRLEDTKSHEVYDGIEIFRIGTPPKIIGTLPVGFFANISFFVSGIINGIKIAKKNKIDLIHSNTYIPVLSAQFCSRLLRIPHIATVHDIYQTSKENFWKDWSKQEGISNITKSIGPWLEKKISKTNVAVFHTVSETSKSDLQKMGTTRKIVVIPNSIDVEQYQRSGIEESNQAIFVGRLVFYKNVEVIIEAFLEVIKKIPDAKLVIVGDGPAKNRLMEKTKKLGLEDTVIFKGKISDEEKIDLIYRSKVLLNPSLVEGFGMVVLEGYCCAKPIIVSDVPPLSNLVNDGTDGYVVDASDVSKWSYNIVQLLSNPALALKMGKAGFEKVKTNYSLEKSMDMLTELYESVL